ncbi:methionine adenosyltransferase, partial [Candidatus Woesearchaeota archaeon]|nr:methionine adenosyltransferase [Candidatus Woesearchaeota archaeon]
GLMFGYATNETDTLMPTPIYYAHKLAKQLADIRKQKLVDYLRPDGKTQVTFEYIAGKPTRLKNVVISTQHDPDIDLEKLQEDLKELVIHKIIPPEFITSETEYFINHVGKFVLGGPQADAGLTGRKIIVDTYGGVGSHGGGCFSGKDPSKVDRSGAYYGRYVAKNIVAAGLAEKCEIQVAYAIGVADPVSVHIDTFGTGTISDSKIAGLVKKHFNFRPKAMIDQLNLKRPIYQKTAAYGHFGREDPDFTWEKTDKAEILKQEAGGILVDVPLELNRII